MALRASKVEATGSPKTVAGAARVVAAKAHRKKEVHRMFPYLSEGITRKTTEAMRIAKTDKWGSCEACLRAKAK